MRSEVGKISLDTVFKERDHLNASIISLFFKIISFEYFLASMNSAAEPWGLVLMRYEIRMFYFENILRSFYTVQVFLVIFIKIKL